MNAAVFVTALLWYPSLPAVSVDIGLRDILGDEPATLTEVIMIPEYVIPLPIAKRNLHIHSIFKSELRISHEIDFKIRYGK